MVKGDERGSEIVQFAIVVPLLLFTVFAIIEVAGGALAVIRVSSDLVGACMSFDVASIEASGGGAVAVKAAIVEASDGLDPSRLTIANVEMFESGREASSLGANDASIVQRTRWARSSFDVSYELPVMIGLGGEGGWRIERHVEWSRDGMREIEVEVVERE